MIELPEWAFGLVFGALFLITLFSFAARNTSRQIAETVAKRPNPTRDEFLTMMASDVSATAAAYLWETASECLSTWDKIAPHPDDHLVDDLPIDDEEWDMDWPRAFAAQHGFSDTVYLDWPEGWPTTLRNYGKWLDMGLAVARKNGLATSLGQSV